MNEDKNNNKNKKESVGSGRACFPTEIAEVDRFIVGVLERYGEGVGDSLFTGDSLFRNAAADLLGAIVTFVLDYLPDEYHTAGTAIELLEDCTWSDDGRIGDPFNLAIFELMSGYRIEYNWDPLLAEQLPFVKPSPLTRNSDGIHPSARVRFGIVRGFMPDEARPSNATASSLRLSPMKSCACRFAIQPSRCSNIPSRMKTDLATASVTSSMIWAKEISHERYE